MAVQFERQLRAAQKFLDGVKSLPNSSEIVIRQYGELSRFLAKVENLTTDVSGRLLSLLDSSLWGAYAEQLKQDIVARTGAKDEANSRRVNQDYMAAVHYFAGFLSCAFGSGSEPCASFGTAMCSSRQVGLAPSHGEDMRSDLSIGI